MHTTYYIRDNSGIVDMTSNPHKAQGYAEDGFTVKAESV